MGKHEDPKESKPGPYEGKHRNDPQYDPDKSFRVDSPEREARGVGNQQTGGRDD